MNKSRRVIILLLVGAFTGISLFSNNVFAQGYGVQQVTNDTTQEFLADSDGDRFVWQTSGGNINLFDGIGVVPIVSGPTTRFRNNQPRISGDYVTWVQSDSQGQLASQVFVYRISDATTTQITSDNHFSKGPVAIESSKIVWPYSNNGQAPFGLGLYDLSTNQTTDLINDTSTSFVEPKLNENTVFWMANSRDIYAKNLISGSVTQITNDFLPKQELRVDGDNVAWGAYDGNDYEVYVYIGGIVRQVTNNTTPDMRVNLASSLVVWMSNQGPMSYNIATMQVELLDVNGLAVVNTNGVLVSWLRSTVLPDNRTVKYPVVKDMATGIITELPVGSDFQNEGEMPLVIGDSFIAWVGLTLSNGFANVYVATPDTIAPSVFGQLDRPSNSNGWYNSDVIIDWHATDSDPSSGTPTDPPDTLATTEGVNVTYTSQPSCDPASNCATGSIALSIDRTIPIVDTPTLSSSIILKNQTYTISAAANDNLSGLWDGEYFIDNDPGSGNGFQMTVLGGDINGNITFTTAGLHTVGVRARDNAGNWSSIQSIIVFVVGTP